MTQKQWSEKLVQFNVQIPEELAKGIELMARLKGISEESMLRFWIEDGLERDELRFERLLLFADVSTDLDEETRRIISGLKARYFDEVSDGDRGLDSYLVKSPTSHYQYKISSVQY